MDWPFYGGNLARVEGKAFAVEVPPEGIEQRSTRFTALVDQDVCHGFLYSLGKSEKAWPPLAPVGWLCSLICLCHGLAKNHMKENILKRQANKEGTTSCEEAACKGLYFEAHLLCRNVLYYERGREKKLKRYNQNVNLFPLGSRLINNFIFFPVFLLYYITFLYLFHK